MNNGRVRTGGLKLDPEVVAWQKQAAENPSTLTKKQKKDRVRVRVKYDLPKEVKEQIETVAKEEGTSASQLAAYLLVWAMEIWADEKGAGKALRQQVFESKEPSRSMRFAWNLRLPGEE